MSMTRKEIIEAVREKIRKRGLTKHVPVEATLAMADVIIEILKGKKNEDKRND